MTATLRVRLTCDTCGSVFEYDTHRASVARDEARRRWGWKHTSDRTGEKDLCRDCKPRVIT
jgi:Fe2+ or Zn2+ uptake regulation protein